MGPVRQSQAAPASERQIIDRCVAEIHGHLPPSWIGSKAAPDPAAASVEATLVIRAPNGDTLPLMVQARRTVAGRDVPGIAEKTRAALRTSSDAVPVLATGYLAPTVRDRLRALGVCYVDATGNIWIIASRPGLLVSGQGADSDPWRGPGRPRGTLKGAPAAKVVRALLDVSRPWTVRELIETSTSSVGATYRVLDYLEREGLVERSTGAIVLPSWRALLEAWARDYDFFRAGGVSTCFAPRGLPWLMHRMSQPEHIRYALTGSYAVPPDARYAAPGAAMIYVEDAAQARDVWDLCEAESGQNVLLCEAPRGAALQRARPTRDPALDAGGSVTLVRPAQAAVDLLGAPGRGPEEGRALLSWMERDEQAWRD